MKKKYKPVNLFSFFISFVFVGIFALFFGIFFLEDAIDLKNNSIEVIATISDIERERDSNGNRYRIFYVDYSYGDKKYENIKLLLTFRKCMYIMLYGHFWKSTRKTGDNPCKMGLYRERRICCEGKIIS